MELPIGSSSTYSRNSRTAELTLTEESIPEYNDQPPEGDEGPPEDNSRTSDTNLLPEPRDHSPEHNNVLPDDTNTFNKNLLDIGAGSIQGLLRTLRCQSCFYYLTRPIRQCTAGHFYCEQCFGRITTCLTCRSAKSTTRCYLPEAFTDHITFPCKYAKHGCDFSAMGPKLKEHLGRCRYTPMRCPISDEMRCRWNGPLHKVQAHCSKFHPTRYFESSHQTFMLNYFNYQYSGYHRYAMLFNAFGKLFTCAIEINYKYMNVKWYVALLTDGEQAKNYSFEIKFINKAHRFNHIVVRSPCDHLKDVARNFSRQFTLSYELLQAFCDESGSLHYSIEIHYEARNYLMESLLSGIQNR